ncbi:MAG: SGNH/GDSL hydrolase family protein [Myxococcota bacterium]|nr:SGNH/GDSL hydrolase family protein [Myxococcota bacterium]
MSTPSWLKRLGVAGVASLVSFALLEGLARVTLEDVLAESSAPPPSPTPWGATLKGNPYLLWEYTPGIREEAGQSVHINLLGLRGQQIPTDKPSGERRVMAIGDSSIYGFGVADDAVFLEQALSLLTEDAGNVQSINAAIPGYSTYQSINLLEMRALTLQPDVLIIGSLWSDNNFDTFRDRDLLDAYSRFESGLPARIHRALSPSAVYRVLDYSLRVRRGPEAKAREVGWTVGNEGGTDGMRRVGINEYARNLDRLVEMAHGIQCEVMFLLLAHPMDLEVTSGGSAAWEIYRTAMRDTARRHGLPLVDVPQLFSASNMSASELFSDALHPSELGHALIGQAVAETLRNWSFGTPLESLPLGEPRPVYNDTFATTRTAH